jgi:hypothetical protein
MVESCPQGRRCGQTLAEIPSGPLPQKMQKIFAVGWLFKRLGTVHTRDLLHLLREVMSGKRRISAKEIMARVGPCTTLVLLAAAKQRSSGTVPEGDNAACTTLVLFAVAKQPLHVRIVLPDPEQVLEPHRLAWVQEASDGFHVRQHHAVREFTPRMLQQRPHRLQGLAHPTEPLIEGAHRILIGGLQVLLDDRRGDLLPPSTLASRALTPVLRKGVWSFQGSFPAPQACLPDTSPGGRRPRKPPRTPTAASPAAAPPTAPDPPGPERS